jgi:signal transduction histidine kinase
MFRALSPRQLTVDIVIACLAVLLRGTIGFESPVVFIVVLGMGATYAVHRLSPLLALIIAWTTVILQMAFNLPPDVSNASVFVVLFATAAYGTPLVRWLGLGSAGLGAFVATTYFVVRGTITESTAQEIVRQLEGNLSRIVVLLIGGFVSSLVLFLLSWTLGLLYRTLLESRAKGAAAERARKEQTEAEREVAIEQERSRIARDMHDVVAHSLAVVIAQADGARYAMKKDAAAADEALATISTTAREALGDVRLLLGQLRHSQGEVPQPVLADLDRLFEQLRGSGLEVDRTDSGEPHGLGNGQQLAVYRIVQESLTNALRHGADPKHAEVRFEWRDRELEVRVSNAFTAASGDLGHGIDGMRERAVLAGGSLTAEPSGDIFVVTATIPVNA